MYGTLEETEDGRPRLRFTRILDHPIEKVWRAITEPEHLAHWFPTTIDGERVAGAELRFEFPDGRWPGFAGTLLAYEPPSVMEISWGPDTLRLELEPTAEGTRLTLLDTLEERGKAARDGAGWHTCLDALGAHLGGDPRPGEQIGDWKRVNAVYIESFGPEAATIGPPEGVE